MGDSRCGRLGIPGDALLDLECLCRRGGFGFSVGGVAQDKETPDQPDPVFPLSSQRSFLRTPWVFTLNP